MYFSAQDLIQDFFYQNWNGSVSGKDVYIKYPNDNDLAFNDGGIYSTIEAQPEGFWGRLSFSVNPTISHSIGNNPLNSEIGSVIVSLFAPENYGTSELSRLSGEVGALMSSITIDNKVQMQECEIRRIGSDGSYYQYNVEIAYLSSYSFR